MIKRLWYLSARGKSSIKKKEGFSIPIEWKYTPIDLWTNPDLVASFLDLDQSGVT